MIPIPGTKRAACVDENLGSLGVHLSAEELKELEDAVPHHEVILHNPGCSHACAETAAQNLFHPAQVC